MLPPITVGELMHPRLEREPFTAAGWVFEHKLDGFRALARVEAGRVELLSRSGRSLNAEFPEVVRAPHAVAGDVVLDCELVVPDGRGHSDLEAVRRRAMTRCLAVVRSAAATAPATLCVFDLLALDERDLRPLPLVDRKAELYRVVPDAPGIRFVRHLEALGEALFAKIDR